MDILLNFYQSVGDCLVASMAIFSLKKKFKNKIRIGINSFSGSDDIYFNNPAIVPRESLISPKNIRMENPLINESHLPYHFGHSYCHVLSRELKVNVKLEINHPVIYLSPEEKSLPHHLLEMIGDRKYWVICLGGMKSDFTVKYYPVEYLQTVVDHYKDKINFVQVGESVHNHIKLNNVIDCVGKTSLRELIRLVANKNCYGCLGGESALNHIAASRKKFMICIASGMLNTSWFSYPTTTILSMHGRISCARFNACGRCKVADNSSAPCLLPVNDFSIVTPKCMEMIKPQDVISVIDNYREGIMDLL